jgi:hypothetical protein
MHPRVIENCRKTLPLVLFLRETDSIHTTTITTTTITTTTNT